MKNYNKLIGRAGEAIACLYLKLNQYNIIKKNFTSKSGEIDIVASKAQNLVFIEVKTRLNDNPIFPAILSIDQKKIKNIKNTASYYIKQERREYQYFRTKNYRYDGIVIILGNFLNKKIFLQHYKNLF